jgi:FkbM family methyltransferase
MIKFIQIGAHNGVMNDPLFRFITNNSTRISGLVVEPDPDLFVQLCKNYRPYRNIIPINLAIHNSLKKMDLYRVKPEYLKILPEFASGIGSFNKYHWKKSKLVPDKKYMQRIQVDCISFRILCQRFKFTSIDLLVIDTEGYDFEIIKSINFRRISPKIIYFEHGVRNRIMSVNQFNKICKLLNSKGYQIISESYDAIAYKLKPRDLVF